MQWSFTGHTVPQLARTREETAVSYAQRAKKARSQLARLREETGVPSLTVR